MSTVNLHFKAGKNKDLIKKFILGEAEYALADVDPSLDFTLDLAVAIDAHGYCCEFCLRTPGQKVIKQVKRNGDLHACVRNSSRAFKLKLSGVSELNSTPNYSFERSLN